MQFDRAPTPTSTPVPRSSGSTPSPSRSQCSSPDPLGGGIQPELGRESNPSQHPSIYYSFASTINADPESGMNGMTTSYAGTTSQFHSRAATVVHVAGPEDATTSRCVSSTVHDPTRMDLEMKEERDGMNEGSKEVSSRTPTTAAHSYFNWTRKLRRLDRDRSRLSDSDSNARPRRGCHITDKYLSSITLTLENSGSVARDHLASERTFLAYVRTSLGCSTMGVALVQLFALTPQASNAAHLHKIGTALGATTVAVGLFIMFVGLARYFRTQFALVAGSFRPAGAVVLAIAGTLSVLVVVIFAVLVGVVE